MPAASTGQTRQRRVDVRIKVNLRFPDKETFVERFSQNLSRTGIFIRASDPAEVGSRIHFEYRLGDDSRIMRGVGIVRWARGVDEARSTGAPPGMGIEFIDLDPQTEQLITEIVSTHGDGERAPQAKKRKRTTPSATAEPAEMAPSLSDAVLDDEEQSALDSLLGSPARAPAAPQTPEEVLASLGLDELEPSPRATAPDAALENLAIDEATEVQEQTDAVLPREALEDLEIEEPVEVEEEAEPLAEAGTQVQASPATELVDGEVVVDGPAEVEATEEPESQAEAVATGEALEPMQPADAAPEAEAQERANEVIEVPEAERARQAVPEADVAQEAGERPEEPTAEEPTAEEPTAEEPTAEEPTAEEPTAEEPTAEEPTAEEPTAEEPTAEEAGAGEPAYAEQGVEEEVTVDEGPAVATQEEGADEALGPGPQVAVIDLVGADLLAAAADGGPVGEPTATGPLLGADEETEAEVWAPGLIGWIGRHWPSAAIQAEARRLGVDVVPDPDRGLMLQIGQSQIAIVDAVKACLSAAIGSLGNTAPERVIAVVPSTIHARAIRSVKAWLGELGVSEVEVVYDAIAILRACGVGVEPSAHALTIDVGRVGSRISLVAGPATVAGALSVVDAGIREADQRLFDAAALAFLRQHAIDIEDDPSLGESLHQQIETMRRETLPGVAWRLSIAGAEITIGAEELTLWAAPISERLALACERLLVDKRLAPNELTVVILTAEEQSWPGVAEALEHALGVPPTTPERDVALRLRGALWRDEG